MSPHIRIGPEPVLAAHARSPPAAGSHRLAGADSAPHSEQNFSKGGLACATAMSIDIAPHKRPLKKLPHHAPDPHLFHIPSHTLLHA